MLQKSLIRSSTRHWLRKKLLLFTASFARSALFLSAASAARTAGAVTIAAIDVAVSATLLATVITRVRDTMEDNHSSSPLLDKYPLTVPIIGKARMSWILIRCGKEGNGYTFFSAPNRERSYRL